MAEESCSPHGSQKAEEAGIRHREDEPFESKPPVTHFFQACPIRLQLSRSLSIQTWMDLCSFHLSQSNHFTSESSCINTEAFGGHLIFKSNTCLHLPLSTFLFIVHVFESFQPRNFYPLLPGKFLVLFL